MIDMRYFNYSHLPEELQQISKEIYLVARYMNNHLSDCAEKTAGLRKLLEAKDCFVRAQLFRKWKEEENQQHMEW